MTELLLSVPSPRCQADRRCDRVPCFQARLDAAGRWPVRRHAEVCAEHLGTVQALAAWARDKGLDGTVTVLAIDQPAPGQPGGLAWPGDRAQRGFAFSIIVLNSQARFLPPVPAGEPVPRGVPLELDH
jgi:hypothetical protein